MGAAPRAAAASQAVDAGLAGNDSLIVLDEAHLSDPFLETLRQVGRYQQWRGTRVVKPTTVVEMSGTPRSKGRVFGLEEVDAEPALEQRLNAVKTAVLKETADLEGTAAAEALRLSEAGAGVVGVVLNTVAAARQTFERLRVVADSVLLTGRVRPFDRDRLLEQFKDRIKAGRNRRERRASLCGCDADCRGWSRPRFRRTRE